MSLGKNGLSFVSFFVAEIFILMSHMLLLEKEQVKFTGCLSVYENMGILQIYFCGAKK